MMFNTPFIHVIHDLFTLVDDEIGSFGDKIQITVGNETGDFDDMVVVDIETCHFEVDPYEWVIYHFQLLVLVVAVTFLGID